MVNEVDRENVGFIPCLLHPWLPSRARHDDFCGECCLCVSRLDGITRRGFGASSSPSSGYSVRRLGDNVVAVLDALKINRPVLVGHSFAGQELSSVATRLPDKIAGAVYLDAAYSYASYDPSVGELAFDLPELQKKLEQLSTSQGDVKLIDELLQTDLPLMERDPQRKKQYYELMAQVPADKGRKTAAGQASVAVVTAEVASSSLVVPAIHSK